MCKDRVPGGRGGDNKRGGMKIIEEEHIDFVFEECRRALSEVSEIFAPFS